MADSKGNGAAEAIREAALEAAQEAADLAETAETAEAIQRLRKALELQIAHQRAHPMSDEKSGRQYDPDKVVFFTPFLGTKLGFAAAVQESLGLTATGYRELVAEAIESGAVANGWKRREGCLTLSQNGRITRSTDAATREALAKF